MRSSCAATAPRPLRSEETTIQLSLLDPSGSKADEPDPAKKPEDKPKPDKPEGLPKPAPRKPKIDFPDNMGERTGKGIGSNKSEGIEPLKALEADEDQAFLSRNPGARGRVANRAANWLMSPGENGRGGHAGSPAPAGAARSASDDIPIPADPLAAPAPRPQESDSAADATPAAPADLPAPRAKVETAADSAAEPAEPSHLQAILVVPAQPIQQASAVPPQPADDLKLSSVSIGPSIAPTPPKAGDEATKGAGRAGINDEPVALASDPGGSLPRTTTQPTRQAGHVDGAPVALQLPVPFIAPTRIAEAKEVPPQPAKPAYALLLMPPPPPAPTPDPARPAIQPPRQANAPARRETPDVSKPAPRAAAAPAAPSVAAPAAGALASAQASGDGRRPGSERPEATLANRATPSPTRSARSAAPRSATASSMSASAGRSRPSARTSRLSGRWTRSPCSTRASR